MNIYTESQKIKKVHFIGIGGINMSALAKHLKFQGFDVSGSDICSNNLSELNSLGIKTYSYHSEKNLQDVDAIVYTSAINSDNPEFVKAKKNGLPLIKRSELLGRIMDRYNVSIAVSGSHGKTTTTNMIAHMLICANLNPTVFLGGEDKGFGNYLRGNGDIVVAEACEYQRNFLDLHPKISVILNIDNDHLDTYKNIEQTASAFYEFSKDSISIINVDDKMAKDICTKSTISIAKEKGADIVAQNISYNGKGYSFSVYSGDRFLGRINLNIAGEHNVYNALSTVAVGKLLNIPFSVQKASLENFSGVKRRNEFIGSAIGMDLFCDYAHHPKEISAMLLTYSAQKERFITVFQPHTYSRTRFLLDEFVKCFNNCSPLIIYKTYPAREKYDRYGSAKRLFNELTKQENLKGKKAYYAKTKDELMSILQSLNQNNKKVVFLGAGDIYQLAKQIVCEK